MQMSVLPRLTPVHTRVATVASPPPGGGAGGVFPCALVVNAAPCDERRPPEAGGCAALNPGGTGPAVGRRAQRVDLARASRAVFAAARMVSLDRRFAASRSLASCLLVFRSLHGEASARPGALHNGQRAPPTAR